MIRSGWLAFRALIAVALMVGFYTLAIAIAAGLFYVAYAESVYADGIDRAAILFIVGGGMIIWSIIPGDQKFVAPGPELRPVEQPRLFDRLNKLALSVGQPMPSAVYLIWDLNAWVAQVHNERVMGIGLPLLQVVTTSQFEAVLAHEFGHYHGGDTALGPWIYRTRGAIGRTVQSLSEAGRGKGWIAMLAFLRFPFIWYGNLFLRISHAISRAQELSADRLAANTVGAEPLADGLRAIHRSAPACSYFLESQVFPIVRSGFSPPLVEGFAGFLHEESIAKKMDEILQADLTTPRTDAYDTHPPLAQRLAALKGMPKAKASDDTPALSLIENLPRVESQLISSWLPDKSKPLKPIQWNDTGFAVLLPSWQKMSAQASNALDGIALENLHYVASKLDAFALKLDMLKTGLPWQDPVRRYASGVLGAAVACALHARGWAIQTAPGEVWLSNGSHRLNPFSIVNRITSGEVKESEWKEMIASYGLDPSMPLVCSERLPAALDSCDIPAEPTRPVCDNCGIPYNPADYRAGAPRIYCSHCGAQLRKPDFCPEHR